MTLFILFNLTKHYIRWLLSSLCTPEDYTSHQTSLSIKIFNTLKSALGVSLLLDSGALFILSTHVFRYI